MHVFFCKNNNPSLHIDYFTNCTFWWLSETTDLEGLDKIRI